MKVTDLLKGKKVKIMTDAKVEVELEIQEVKLEHRSKDLEPATIANDWWPRSENWTTIDVTFTNGYRKSYRNLNEIQLIE
jgi:hypothetical protein